MYNIDIVLLLSLSLFHSLARMVYVSISHLSGVSSSLYWFGKRKNLLWIRHSASFKIVIVSQAIVILLKILILSQKPLRVGAQPKLKHSNEQLSFGDCKSNSSYKITRKRHASPSVHSSYTPGNFCTSTNLLRWLVPPQKFIDVWPPTGICVKFI